MWQQYVAILNEIKRVVRTRVLKNKINIIFNYIYFMTIILTKYISRIHISTISREQNRYRESTRSDLMGLAVDRRFPFRCLTIKRPHHWMIESATGRRLNFRITSADVPFGRSIFRMRQVGQKFNWS